jgi:hypothetical protein
MARVQSGSLSFSVAAQKTLEETQRILVKIAKREHGKVMATAPRPVSFDRFVDGRKGALEEAVKPTGTIVYTYPRLEVVAQFAMETLFDLSPVLSGKYRASHTLFLNGSAVPNLRDFKPGDEATISNPVPYSRKIEVGKMKMRVPGTSMVYAKAAKIVRARYGNIAKIGFTYRGLVGGGLVDPIKAGASTLKRGPNGRFMKQGGPRPHNIANLRYPVLTISEL